ncbi:MAG TPA: hypothetical protein VOB72_11655 [Candidatus Dormibacteraeota bacterium]|nr:hypothetical protein [Candidatus Dormibacteraeota bacterium]
MLAQPLIRDRPLSVHHAGPLVGAVRVEGAKHSFAHLLAVAGAAETLHVAGAPWQLDARCLTYALSQVFETTVVRPDREEITFQGVRTRRRVVIPAAVCAASRQLYCLLPALLLRAGTVVLEAPPSGCALGARPSAWYLDTLRRFGASVEETAAGLLLRRGRLRPAEVAFPAPSMTGSVIALALAAFAPGRSRIRNVSEETSVSDMMECVAAMGIELARGPGGEVDVDGGTPPREARVRVPPDRVQAVTYLTAGVLAGGRVEVSGRGELRVEPFLALLRSLGLPVHHRADRVVLEAPADPEPGPVVEVAAGPEPRFPSDWTPFALLALARAGGAGSAIVDTAFGDRFAFVRRLGGGDGGVLALEDGGGASVARVRGRLGALLGGPVEPPSDIRGAAALALTGVSARRAVVLSSDLDVQRGYGRFRADLGRLGVREVA